ncbi:nestin isoform X2 [Salmo salar]|nr:nestin-like isoform X2 [Salmo salar]XP_014034527.1 nestin-like isoform X2 [Salmo salar]XP_014034528.1 nestin-like isoform X2 [Salmo salar]XP_045566035.1 nestin-like isoform X2 [Salmo salar]XP_045566037.1 nestin-like isoform X2 [Salmo salar]|eukprot:XP_014034526.1 PREDICTED: nestin-like [Salmo salar]
MMKNHEEDVFVAVRVQDPRVQNEGSWNSYVDFKIFLHTNSKSFTAKTSCVRRRYSEFVWLKKRMQKNTGLVPVPDLPSKSFFSFSGEDFLEKRRKGLQSFLAKVCSMTVCLSDSQLHLFLQTQLPVGHILDCVQGHTPYTVTEAILTYASSNQGWVQEEDSTQEPSLTPVPYESMESPAPHLPTLQCQEPLSPVNLASSEPEGLWTEKFLADTHDIDTVETLSPEVTQEDRNVVQAEAILEIQSPVETIFKWDSHEESTPERLDHEAMIHHQGDCQLQTPVEVHFEKDTGLEEECVVEVTTERVIKEESHADDITTETIPPKQSSLDPDSHEELIHQGECKQQTPEEEATGLEKECVSEEANTDTTTETIPPKQRSPELHIHEETPRDGDSLRETVLEDLSLAEEAQESISHEKTTSEGDSNKDTLTAIELDSQGHMDEIKYHIEISPEEECHEIASEELERVDDSTQKVESGDVATQEVESGDETPQKKNAPLDIQQVDDQLVGATTSDGSSHKESDNKDSANNDNAIQETNDYMETAPEKENHQTVCTEAEKACNNPDTVIPKTNRGPSHDEIATEVPNAQGTNCVKVREDRDILYMVNSYSAKTLENESSELVGDGVELKDMRIQESSHLEFEGHCTEQDISLAQEGNTEASEVSQEWEAHAFTAATNQTVSPEMEP